jgi:NADH-quinone oxidoreductase subunit A
LQLLENYGYIALFLLFVFLLACVMALTPLALKLLRIVPHKPNPIKSLPFECGMESIGKTWVQFNFRYYFYALLLISMDVMVVFLYPWAAELERLGTFGLAAILVFVFIIVVGYIYAWRKKALEWK